MLAVRMHAASSRSGSQCGPIAGAATSSSSAYGSPPSGPPRSAKPARGDQCAVGWAFSGSGSGSGSA